jgi:hypothetical protein
MYVVRRYGEERRIIFAGPLRLLAFALNRASTLANRRAELERELSELRRARAEEGAAYQEFRDAVAARRQAESELVENYRTDFEARLRGETPRRWLH